MKIEQVSEHIWCLKHWMLIPVRVWVVVDEEGVTLVDTGVSYMAKNILKLVDQLHAGPLQRILLTHGHSDHVGSVQKILNTRSVPVYAHSIEIPYLEGALPYPRRKKPENTVAKGLVQPLPVAGENGDTLQKIAGLQPYLTPGHAPGHVVYYHEQDGVLLAGDLFTSKRGKLHRPMPIFTADMAEALRSSRVIERLNPKRVEVCHGKPVFEAAGHLDEYIRSTASSMKIPSRALEQSLTI